MPYIRKLKKGEISGFEKKYKQLANTSKEKTWQLQLLKFGSLFMAVIDIFSGIQFFASAFAFGFARNSVINEGTKWKNSSPNN